MFARLGPRIPVARFALLGKSRPQSVRFRRNVLVHGARLASSLKQHADVEITEKKVTIRVKPPGPEAPPMTRSFPNLWLRDNCQCQQCVNQDTRQRNFDTFKLPVDIIPVSVEETPDHLHVTWSDSHKSQHPWTWLQAWTPPNGMKKEFGSDHGRHYWTSEIAESPPVVDYTSVMDESSDMGMAKLTKNIWVHGFTFVDQTPATPEATEALLNKIGPIRNTHYGGFYDFIPDLALADTAYTNLALPAHTDTTYFTEPAGLQAFHLLSHSAPPTAPATDGVLGGQSLLVDGFKAALTLKAENPHAFDVLRRVKLPWHASGNKGIAIVPDQPYPVIELDNVALTRVRWNNDDRGVVNPREADIWYKAAAKWNEILRRESSEYWYQLQPGRVVIFNNWRVMHGRSAFEGVRRICGAYIPYDDFVSRYRTTNFAHEDVIGRNLHMQGARREKVPKGPVTIPKSSEVGEALPSLKHKKKKKKQIS